MRLPQLVLSLILSVPFVNLAAGQTSPGPATAVTAPQVKRAAAVALIERGSQTEWRYLDDGAQPHATWTSADFDDGLWKQGRSPLGFGEPDVSTEIGFGDNAQAKHLAAYFRRSFDFAEDPARLRQLVVEMRIDDGVVVYLNGRELVRQNLPAGPMTVRTRAVGRVEGAEERIYQRHVVPATALKAGRNVLAAAVHQINAVSSDLFFDLQLTASAEEELPVLRVTAAARAVTLAYLRNHYVPAGTRIPDGYVDGGRGMRIAAAGTLSSKRELIVVDRARDGKLRQHLDYVRWLMRADVPPLERATLLAQYVDQQYSPTAGRAFAEEACTTLLAPFYGKERLIGDVIHAGVCRHRALVFKLLADEAGLSVALVRGNLGTAKKFGGHAWNELILADGNKAIVDVMNPRPGFRFPLTTDRVAERYLTVRNDPYYVRPKASAAIEQERQTRTGQPEEMLASRSRW